MTYPIFDPRGAVDLSEVEAIAALRQARDAERQRNAEEEKIRAWDRAMTRAFKGIVSRSTRMNFMRAEHRRLERES